MQFLGLLYVPATANMTTTLAQCLVYNRVCRVPGHIWSAGLCRRLYTLQSGISDVSMPRPG